jgi:hypothetical protein
MVRARRWDLIQERELVMKKRDSMKASPLRLNKQTLVNLSVKSGVQTGVLASGGGCALSAKEDCGGLSGYCWYGRG